MPDYLITWIHLIAAHLLPMILIGGLIFSQCVLNPVVHHAPPDQQSKEILQAAGRRFRTIVWVCLITLIVTGAYHILNESGSVRIETTWGVVLLLKLFFFVIAFGLILIHDFIIDPHASSSTNTSTPSGPAPSSQAHHLQNAIILMMLAVLLVASYLTTI